MSPGKGDIKKVFSDAAVDTMPSDVELLGYMEEANAHFRTDRPNAREVIDEVVGRFYPFKKDYGIIGAATAW